MSGYALLTLFSWLPIWQMGQAGGARIFFGYFVTVCLLIFGVFMVSGNRQDFRIIPFTLAACAGAVVSFGVGMSLMAVAACGVAAIYVVFLMFAPE